MRCQCLVTLFLVLWTWEVLGTGFHKLLQTGWIPPLARRERTLSHFLARPLEVTTFCGCFPITFLLYILSDVLFRQEPLNMFWRSSLNVKYEAFLISTTRSPSGLGWTKHFVSYLFLHFYFQCLLSKQFLTNKEAQLSHSSDNSILNCIHINLYCSCSQNKTTWKDLMHALFNFFHSQLKQMSATNKRNIYFCLRHFLEELLPVDNIRIAGPKNLEIFRNWFPQTYCIDNTNFNQQLFNALIAKTSTMYSKSSAWSEPILFYNLLCYSIVIALYTMQQIMQYK